MIDNFKKWITNKSIFISIIIALVMEYLLINNFNNIPITDIDEFFKTYTGLIAILVAGIPTWVLLSANYKKVKQETKNLMSQQEFTIAQTLDSYNKQLTLEIDHHTHTLVDMQKQIDLRDIRIDELAKETDIRTSQIEDLTKKISQLTMEIETLKKVKMSQDNKIYDLTVNLDNERKARLLSETELIRLKVYSEKIVKDNSILTDRVKVLEDYIRANDFPVPNGN